MSIKTVTKTSDLLQEYKDKLSAFVGYGAYQAAEGYAEKARTEPCPTVRTLLYAIATRRQSCTILETLLVGRGVANKELLDIKNKILGK